MTTSSQTATSRPNSLSTSLHTGLPVLRRNSIHADESIKITNCDPRAWLPDRRPKGDWSRSTRPKGLESIVAAHALEDWKFVMTVSNQRVEVARRIPAPADTIFAIIATPDRQKEFDGSDMLRGSDVKTMVSGVGDKFTMQMHRLGRDYAMINYVVDFEFNRRIAWEPAPGDVDTAGGDPEKIGVPAGYQWGYILEPEGDSATRVTEFFDVGPAGVWILEKEGGSWINGHNTVKESMDNTLELLERAALK